MKLRWTNALLILATLLAALPAQAQTPGPRPDYWDYGWGWGHMMFGGLSMLLLWGGIIVLIVFAVRWLGGRSAPGGEPPAARQSALDILEERFARGEIDKEEFEERKRLLSK